MTQVQCPVCHEDQFTIRMERMDIPYFGEILQFVMLCDACGFRRTDFHVVHESEPVRYTFPVRGEDDLVVRVVRSATGHFQIPELGITVTPAEGSDAFVTNIEGVLDRCVQAIEIALHGADDEATAERAQSLLDRTDAMRAGREPWTLVLEDPLGNSAIVSDDAERRVLTKDEAEALGLPYVVIDAGELREAAEE